MKDRIQLVHGNLLDQNVEVIVNSWNQNFIPYFLLLPQGVSGAIKKKAGLKPFNELLKIGFMKLGSGVVTSSGNLAYRAIIHVAGINIFWFASENSVRKSMQSALKIAQDNQFKSIALPLIGAGTGGLSHEKVQHLMLSEAGESLYEGDIIIVIYNSKNRR